MGVVCVFVFLIMLIIMEVFFEVRVLGFIIIGFEIGFLVLCLLFEGDLLFIEGYIIEIEDGFWFSIIFDLLIDVFELEFRLIIEFGYDICSKWVNNVIFEGLFWFVDDGRLIFKVFNFDLLIIFVNIDLIGIGLVLVEFEVFFLGVDLIFMFFLVKDF